VPTTIAFYNLSLSPKEEANAKAAVEREVDDAFD
jgi:hypothetical protein